MRLELRLQLGVACVGTLGAGAQYGDWIRKDQDQEKKTQTFYARDNMTPICIYCLPQLRLHPITPSVPERDKKKTICNNDNDNDNGSGLCFVT